MFHSPLPFPPSLGFHPHPPLRGQGCKQMKSHYFPIRGLTGPGLPRLGWLYYQRQRREAGISPRREVFPQGYGQFNPHSK